jgi:hypothetical protein
VLGDRRSWIAGGRVSFKRVSGGGNTQVYLASPENVDRLCEPLNTNGQVSCSIGSRVVFNVDRWRGAVSHWPSKNKVGTYRKMLINHEFGHRIGLGHQNCPGGGQPAPVMQQQTYGLQGCEANWWPRSYELSRLRSEAITAAEPAPPPPGTSPTDWIG